MFGGGLTLGKITQFVFFLVLPVETSLIRGPGYFQLFSYYRGAVSMDNITATIWRQQPPTQSCF